MVPIVYKTRPLAAAALGACLAYYAAVPAAGGVFQAAAAAGLCGLSLLRALATVWAVSAPPSYRRAARYGSALAAFLLGGFALGGSARLAAEKSTGFSIGQTLSGVTALSGALLDDPRLSRSGRGIGTVALRWASGEGVTGAARAVKTSARGNVPVLFQMEAVARIKAFGRGSTVWVDGRFTDDGGLFLANGAFVVSPPNTVNRWRTAFRAACVDKFAPRRWGGLALALLIGIRDNLDGELALRYQNAGVSYILALSGMHLAVISAVITFLLRRPLGLKPAAVCGALLITGYGYLAGALPSLERAILMYILGAAAVVFGLPRKARLLLSCAFLTQLTLRPASGMSPSFILSYGALFGILTWSGPLQRCIRGYAPPFIAAPLAASITAFAATMAVTAGFFGTVRPAGIVSGLCLAPLTTVFMIGAMAFPLASLAPPVARVLDAALTLLYTLLEKIVSLAGAVPPANLPPGAALAVSAAFIAGLTLASPYILKKRLFFDRTPLEL
jgi:competence protein ComEC